MRSRLPSWILLLYLALDLANPFVPGAVCFTPEDGLVWVEATPHATALRDGEHWAPKGRRRQQETIVPDMPGRTTRAAMSVPLRTRWLADVRTGDPPARDFPPPANDDHLAPSPFLVD